MSANAPTLKAKIQELLVSHGLWPQEAEQVFARIEAAPSNDSMKQRWNDSPDAYPPNFWRFCGLGLSTTLLNGLKRTSLNTSLA